MSSQRNRHAPEGARTLIVNADDFGMSRGVNRGVVEAHKRGVVTRVRDGRWEERGAGWDRRGLPCRDAITLDGLVRIITSLPQGVTELACHPGRSTDLEDDYGDERGLELEVLCDPRVREELERRGVRLAAHREISFGQEAAWSGA